MKIVGVWNTTKTETRIGSFLIFLAELSLLREIKNASSLSITIESADPEECVLPVYGLTEFLPALDFVEYSIQQQPEASNEATFFWPTETSVAQSSYAESMLAFGELTQKVSYKVPLSPSQRLKKLADNWLEINVRGAIPIVVHLKNNPRDLQSNANQRNWIKFFQLVQEIRPDIKFILIGNEELDSEFLGLDNVVIAADRGSSLALELTLILCAFCFMGMSSGPCNMAILTEVPYLIWKHPNHHKEIMDRELTGDNGFSFSDDKQKFIRDWDTAESLLTEFEILLKRLESKKVSI